LASPPARCLAGQPTPPTAAGKALFVKTPVAVMMSIVL
jgi:hypothetical protein